MSKQLKHFGVDLTMMCVTHDVLQTLPILHGNNVYLRNSNHNFIELNAIQSNTAGIQVGITIIRFCFLATSQQ